MPKETEPLTEREQRVVELLSEARASVRAPHSLRTRIDAQRPARATRARLRVIYGAATAAALAAAALLLVLLLPTGTPAGPSASQAAALALNGPTAPAPPPNPRAPRTRLDRDVSEVYFPNLSTSFGWRAVGQRADRLSGHQALTVYYRQRRAKVAYTIVATPPLTNPAGTITKLNGISFRTLNLDGRPAVTWRRRDHTCVLSAMSANVSVGALRELAAWQAPDQGR
jgi:hypothetical protein